MSGIIAVLIFFGLLPYLLLFIWLLLLFFVVRGARAYARRKGKSTARWGWGSVFVMFVATAIFWLYETSGFSWKEEALLHDGSKLIVKRHINRGGRAEIGQRGGDQIQTLSFIMPNTERKIFSFSIPNTGQEIEWRDKATPDIGHANFIPLTIDIVCNTPYIVLDTAGCNSYNKWGRPNPPYVVFKYQAGQWMQISLSELPAEVTRPNVIISGPDVTVQNLKTKFVTALKVQELNSSLSSHRRIIREPLPEKDLAEERVYIAHDNFGYSGWRGANFSSQPTYEACLQKCSYYKIEFNLRDEECPCDIWLKTINKEKWNHGN